MSDRLDRAEALLEAHGNAMADLATKQEMTQRQIDSTQRQIDSTQHQIDSLLVAVDRTNTIVTELANIVYAVSNRQEDHEHRITRLEDRL
jgi:peptidoglycan hydrolase CwlO-like protein